ncbi:MAG: 30S ribosomal protein S1 [Candidatus Eremiobacteraeota bacterium]|nr:30S ribosomal protein S1 [Candidatus Eremiobacteraeota bacterium]
MTEAQPTETTDAEQQSEQAEASAAAEQAPKEEAKKAEPEATQETMSMESLMASHDAYEESFRELKRGEFLTGRVIQVNDDGAMVDVGYKTEGFIPVNQLTHRKDVNPRELLEEGQDVKVVVLKVNHSEGQVLLSKRQADVEAAWFSILEAHQNGEVLESTCVEQVKGGLIVDIGLRGFVPASHVDLRPVSDLSDYVGEVMRLKVLEVDQKRRKVVLSRKKALEDERDKLKEKTLNELAEGQIVSGEVARLTNFGAFVNLGGVDGLVHISEMSWKRIKHPSEIVRVGEQVDVRVLGVDRSKERISLSLKQARPDPWQDLEEKFGIGNVVPGKVTKLAKNYAFVEVMDGIEGLVPLSELSEFRVSKSSDVLTVGQEVKVRVIDLKPDQRRMTLSVRQAEAGISPNVTSNASTGQAGGFTIGDRLPDSLKHMLADNE